MHPTSLIVLPAVAVLVGGGPRAASLASPHSANTRRVAPSHTTQPRSVSAEMAAQFQASLAEWAGDPRHFGVTAAVRFPDGRGWRGAAGSAGADGPMRSDHHVQVASIGKTMTAALILRLVDAGTLRLTDSVGALLPPIRHVDPGITLRQLLTHTSGVSAYGTPEFARAMAANPSRAWRAEEILPFIPPPAAAPGVRTAYTNTAFLLFGYIAERTLGAPLGELYRRELWQPLGLTQLFLPMQPPTGRVAQARVPQGAVIDPLEIPARATAGQGAGGVFATAEAIAAWGDAFFRGSVVSPAMQRELRTIVPAAGNIPGESGAGLGVRAYAYLGRQQFGHSGGSILGNSLMLHDPATGITVAVLMNQGANADHFALAPRLLGIATQAVRASP